MRTGNDDGRSCRCQGWRRTGPALAMFSAMLLATAAPTLDAAQAAGLDAGPIKARHGGASRAGATQLPRSEGDQAVVDGWPLYRTERGQSAFNDAMATLQATDGAAPAPAIFKDCASLECNVALPALSADGWIPAGRIWVSATDYVLIAHSPRPRAGMSSRRRAFRSMRYFVFHE